MSYAVVAEKLKTVPEYYMQEVSEFIDFLFSIFSIKGFLSILFILE